MRKKICILYIYKAKKNNIYNLIKIQKMNINTSNKKNYENKESIINSSIESCLINVIYSYVKLNFTGIINCPIYNNNEFILTSELLKKLEESIQVNDFQIFLFNSKYKSYILIGVYPSKITQDKIYIKESIINPKNKDMITIKLKFRQIINKDNALKMEYSILDEEKNEEKSENSFKELGLKTRRAKERKIGSVIKKVYIWRKLYTGFQDEQGRSIKLTLDEAANKVGISKKSLDDYLIQLRIGKFFNFNFTEHKNDKVGILRAFVKKHKQQYEKEKKNIKNEQNNSFIGKKRKK